MGNLSEEISNKTFLSSVGVKIALQGHLPFYVGLKSVYETMKSLKNGVDPEELKTNILPTDQINKLINSEEFNQKIKKFL